MKRALRFLLVLALLLGLLTIGQSPLTGACGTDRGHIFPCPY